MLNIKIKKIDANQRIDKYVKKVLGEAPSSFIYKLFRKKDVKVNKHWAKIDYILKEEDELSIYINDIQLEEFKKSFKIEDLKFNREIKYEDDNILVVNKPKGLLIHGDKNEQKYTLSNEVLSYLYKKGELNSDDSFKPSPAHRLDRNTSGLVFFGKNNRALQELMLLFKEKKNINKYYYALVDGKLNKEGTIDKSLFKDEKKNTVYISNDVGSKSALTKYKLIEYIKDYSLAEVQILTGRTHQIRVHLSYIGHPIIGDAKYGNFTLNKRFEKINIKSQMLHAYKISFNKVDGFLHYLSYKEFTSKVPKYFLEAIDLIKKGEY